MMASSEMLWPRWAARRSWGLDGSVQRLGRAGFQPAKVTQAMVPVMGPTRVRFVGASLVVVEALGPGDAQHLAGAGLALRQRKAQIVNCFGGNADDGVVLRAELRVDQ